MIFEACFAECRANPERAFAHQDWMTYESFVACSIAPSGKIVQSIIRNHGGELKLIGQHICWGLPETIPSAELIGDGWTMIDVPKAKVAA